MIDWKSNRGAWLIGLALVGITMAIYWPVRDFDFVQYDDPEYVFENETVRAGLTWWGLVWSIVDAHASNWHPVTWLSHMMDCQFFGLSPGGHHLVNALLHSINAGLLFVCLRAMTGAVWRSALVAALFAWHPLRVESVAWISERKDVLSGLFFLLTVWAYATYVKERGSVGAQRRLHARRYYALALSFFACGLLSKPMLVTLPIILLLLDYWPLKRVGCKSKVQSPKSKVTDPFGAEGFSPLGDLLREKIPFFALSVAVGVITFLAQRASGAMISLKSEGIGARLCGVVMGYVAYLEKLFWPHDLAVLYLRPVTVPAGQVAIAALILAVFSIGVAVLWRRCPYLIVGWLWFVVMLLPVCGLVQTGLQSIADRYTYLPSIGVCLMIVWGFGGVKSEGRRISAFGLRILAIVVVIACLFLTRNQLRYWRNTETLMSRALAMDPANYIAHNDLAVYYDKHGQPEAARWHRERVRELDPELKHENRRKSE